MPNDKAQMAGAMAGMMAAQPEAQNIIAVGDNPILRDVAAAHEPLLHVRQAVAGALLQVSDHPDTVLAFSIVSAGKRVEDQMVVFSPGGDALRNANEALVRMKAATEQLETLIKGGAFGG